MMPLFDIQDRSEGQSFFDGDDFELNNRLSHFSIGGHNGCR